jgi:hypothetical protein
MKDLLVPPKAELKCPQVNFKELVYPKIKNQALEVKKSDLLFSLTHGIYCNRARLFQQNRAEDNLYPKPACKRENLVEDIEHLFCTCYKERSAWQWITMKMLELLREKGSHPDTNNMDCILAMFPKSIQEAECILLLGAFVELVDQETVLKQKELLVNTVIGVLKNKSEYALRRAVPQVQLPLA